MAEDRVRRIALKAIACVIVVTMLLASACSSPERPPAQPPGNDLWHEIGNETTKVV